MKIIVIGGGIGGLAVAAGLRRQQFDVKVFERDLDPAVTQGYHITLHEEVQQALAELLGQGSFDRILASAANGRQRDPDVFWDWRGRVIGHAPQLTDPGIDIDRISLRVLLAEAVGDDLVLGRAFVGYDKRDDGKVSARFSDGSSVVGDILIGADGTHSNVVKQLFGKSTNAPTGIVGVCGRTPASRLSENMRRKLGTRSSLAMGPHAVALYIGYLDPIGHAVLDRPDLRAAITTEPTYIWGAMFPESDRARALKDQRGSALLEGTLDIMRQKGWTSRILDVVTQSNLDDIAMFRFNAASTNSSELAPWSPSQITALGDAVHATPPTAGMGAGIAIRDAADLVHELVAVRRGDKALETGMHDFESRMRIRGSNAISAAMKTIKVIKATDRPFGSILTRIALPMCAAFTTTFGGGERKRSNT